MLLKISDFELEIVEGKFVCFVDNQCDTTHFCEWKVLDPKLQTKFTSIKGELLQLLQKFVESRDKEAFESVSEQYRQEEHD